ncbi:MAG: tetratricopeptide repeat protein [Prolixibacteraceae bacterium]|jgi:tetratricopeptide (TPR) repeat protein|nr:tetratricopeptide repeat protein [Prolixibacteraceae bacterium]
MKFLLLNALICLIIGGYSLSPGFVDSISFELGKGELSEEEIVQYLLELSYQNQDEPMKAIEYGKNVIAIAKKNDMKRQLAYAHGYVGMAELRLGNHRKGIEHFIKSAELFRELGLYQEEGYALGSIGTAFQKQDDLPNSIKYNQQCLDLFEQAEDTFFIANTLLNIGEAYRVFGITDSAELYYDESMKCLNLLEGNPSVVKRKALLNGNLGLLHVGKGLLDKAETELEAAYFYFEHDNSLRTTFMSNLGRVYYMKGDTLKGIEYMAKAYEIASQENLKVQSKDISLQLSEAYEKMNDYQNSLSFYKRFKMYNDSLKDIFNCS